MFIQRKQACVSFKLCRATMTASLLWDPTERTYRNILKQFHGMDIRGGAVDTYVVSFPRILTVVTCPVEGCPERAHNPGWLREHFIYRHWKSKIVILGEVLVTWSSPRRQLFLHALSFECTSNLCIKFINQFSKIFSHLNSARHNLVIELCRE